MQAVHAESEARALQIAAEKAQSLDCLLVDLTLPGLDGWSLLRQLRQSAETAPIPVMVVVGRPPNETEMVKLLQAGVMDHVVKPLTSALFCAKVKAVCERS